MHATFRDVIVFARDTGMRNKRELFCARIEDIDWNSRVLFIPDSKTPNGRRFVPISDRVLELLRVRCGDRREGWIFTCFLRIRPFDQRGSEVPGGEAGGETSGETSALLRKARLRNQGAAGHRQSCGAHAHDGTR